jgi:hypothetical protein
LYRPLIACGAAVALGGCVAAAAPLAQMAVSSFTSPTTSSTNQPCTQPNGCNTGITNMSLQDVAKKFNMSMQKWTGTAPDDQAASPTGAQGMSSSLAQGALSQGAQGVSAPVVQSVAHTTVQPGWQTQLQTLPAH